MRFRGEQFVDGFGLPWTVVTVEPCPAGTGRALVSLTQGALTRTVIVPGPLDAVERGAIAAAVATCAPSWCADPQRLLAT